MDYNDFENILNAYFFKDMLQNMLQNHFFLENVNTFLEACCAGYTLYILYIIQYTYLWTKCKSVYENNVDPTKCWIAF